MIYLEPKKDYFILIDKDGAEFASGCLFESVQDLAQAFQQWAECDGYEDPNLTGWSIGDCISHWNFECKYYQVNDFVEIPEQFTSFIINQK